MVNAMSLLRRRFQFRWPDPHEVRRVDNHLQMGVSVEAVEDFLGAIGWMKDYVRTAAHISLNGELVKGQEIGYDLAKYIRTLLRDKGLAAFSVAEILLALQHPGVQLTADAFLSHTQVERITKTLLAMKKARGAVRSSSCCARSPTFFVDYFVLRQAQADFVPAEVRSAIAAIGHLVIVLDPHVEPVPRNRGAVTLSPEAGLRVWCGFEMFSAVVEKTKISGVFTLSGWLAHDPDKTDNFNIDNAQSTDPTDKARLMQYIRDDGLSTHDVNRQVRLAISSSAKSATESLVAQCISIVGILFVVACLWTFWFHGTFLRDHAYAFTSTGVLFVYVLMVLTSSCLEMKSGETNCPASALLRAICRPWFFIVIFFMVTGWAVSSGLPSWSLESTFQLVLFMPTFLVAAAVAIAVLATFFRLLRTMTPLRGELISVGALHASEVQMYGTQLVLLIVQLSCFIGLVFSPEALNAIGPAVILLLTLTFLGFMVRSSCKTRHARAALPEQQQVLQVHPQQEQQEQQQQQQQQQQEQQEQLRQVLLE